MTNVKKVFLDLLIAGSDVLVANAEELYETDEDFALVCFNLAHELLDRAREIVDHEKQHTSKVRVRKLHRV